MVKISIVKYIYFSFHYVKFLNNKNVLLSRIYFLPFYIKIEV